MPATCRIEANGLNNVLQTNRGPRRAAPGPGGRGLQPRPYRGGSTGPLRGRPVHRGRAVRGGGYLLVAASAAFIAYFSFQAVEPDGHGRAVDFRGPGGVRLFGAMLIRLAGQMQAPARLAAAGVSPAGNVVASRRHEANGASIILPFRQLSFAAAGLLSLSCASCGSAYLAYSADEGCTACNRGPRPAKARLPVGPTSIRSPMPAVA